MVTIDTRSPGAPRARWPRALGRISAMAMLASLTLGMSCKPLAYTRTGWVLGERVGEAERFLGIPYAAAPVGELRWRAPVPAPPWPGLRAARELGPECAQLPSVSGPGSVEEDCLVLNVYRPSRRGWRPHRRPVLVWIHGGSLLHGSGNQFDASELAARTDTVVVTLNYRLGVFGALALPGLTGESPDGSSGNLSLLDQQAALRWVRKNIRSFGGDPRNVTIAGESAGGEAVCSHLASPTAKGLFHRAIVQSGAFDLAIRGGPPCDLLSLPEAQQRGEIFADAAGCLDPATRVSCLREKTAEELLAASGDFGARNNVSGAILPEPILDAIEAGRWNRVPVMVGSTHDEGQPAAVTIGLGFPLLEALYNIAVHVLLGPAEAPAALAEYPAAAYEDPAFALGALSTDAGFACPTHTLRSILAQQTPVYGYEFNDPDAPPELIDGMPSGAYHASELSYLFEFTPPLHELSEAQEALSTQMMRYWAAFASRGAPEVGGEPLWRPFTLGHPSILSLEKEGSHEILDFAADHHCDFWLE